VLANRSCCFQLFYLAVFDSIEFVFHVVITVTDLGIVKFVVLNSPGDHRVRNYTIKSIGSNTWYQSRTGEDQGGGDS